MNFITKHTGEFSSFLLFFFKVTVYLQRCLASKRCSASGLNCRYLNPYIKLKLIELAIKLNQEFFALFSRINFFTWRSLFKKLKRKGNLFVCLQILTVASLTYKQQKCVCEFFLSKYFSSERDFCTITPHSFRSYFENVL